MRINKKSLIFLLLILLTISLNMVSAANAGDIDQNSISAMDDDMTLSSDLEDAYAISDSSSSSDIIGESNENSAGRASSNDTLGIVEAESNDASAENSIDLASGAVDSVDDDSVDSASGAIDSVDDDCMDSDSDAIDSADDKTGDKAILSANALFDGENIIYISPSGSASGDGSRNHPYNNIRTALNICLQILQTL